MSWRRWLARFSFSLLALGFVVAWAGHEASKRGRSPTLHYAGAAVLIAAGIIALRERHRSN